MLGRHLFGVGLAVARHSSSLATAYIVPRLPRDAFFCARVQRLRFKVVHKANCSRADSYSYHSRAAQVLVRTSSGAVLASDLPYTVLPSLVHTCAQACVRARMYAYTRTRLPARLHARMHESYVGL